MQIRNIEPEDCSTILAVVSDWWGANYSSDMFSKSYIHHFRETCLLAEENGLMIGFLLGFLSQSDQNQSYIRIVMVDPSSRGKGVGRALYEEFTKRVGLLGRKEIRCVTAPRKKDSIEFHTRLGFLIESQNHEVDGIPVVHNYDGRGGDRVVFKKLLS